MIRSILSVGHPLLRVPARYLTQTELMAPKTQQCIDDLIETMRHAQEPGSLHPKLRAVQVAAILPKTMPVIPTNQMYRLRFS